MINFVADKAALKAVCERAKQQAFVILDTEFVRTRTLYPLLGLVQLNDGQQVSLIDPTVIDDLTPLKELLLAPSCLKVLHSCSEDLEAFQRALGVMPTPLFDTQFAAQFLGLGTTMGYANLVETLLAIKLDKGESRTDWLARPLSEKQLHYAANDVIHLHAVYTLLNDKLSEQDRQIVLAEAANLANKKAAYMPTEFAYLNIKNNWKLKGKSLLALKYLASWRLQRARDKNMALNFVLKENTLIAIAMALPGSKTALSKLSSVTPQEVRINGHHIVRIIQQVEQEAEIETCDIPSPVKRLSELKKYKPAMAQLKNIIATIATETGISAEILSSKKQLHQFLKYTWFSIDEYRAQGLVPDVLTNWRAPLFEPYLTQLEL